MSGAVCTPCAGLTGARVLPAQAPRGTAALVEDLHWRYVVCAGRIMADYVRAAHRATARCTDARRWYCAGYGTAEAGRKLAQQVATPLFHTHTCAVLCFWPRNQTGWYPSRVYCDRFFGAGAQSVVLEQYWRQLVVLVHH